MISIEVEGALITDSNGSSDDDEDACQIGLKYR